MRRMGHRSQGKAAEALGVPPFEPPGKRLWRRHMGGTAYPNRTDDLVAVEHLTLLAGARASAPFWGQDAHNRNLPGQRLHHCSFRLRDYRTSERGCLSWIY